MTRLMQRHLWFTQITVSDKALSNHFRNVFVALQFPRHGSFFAKRQDTLWQMDETKSKNRNERKQRNSNEGNISGSLCAVFFFISQFEYVTLPRRRRISLALIKRPAGRVNVLFRFIDLQRNKPVSPDQRVGLDLVDHALETKENGFTI